MPPFNQALQIFAVRCYHLFMRKVIFSILIAVMVGVLCQPARAVDPPYQNQMQQLLGIAGSLYFLQPLCGNDQNDWRQHAAELIAFDDPADDRRQRLNGAFNQGFEAYARLHQNCSDSARQTITRLLLEADRLTRDIYSRYAE
ncbi:MAG: TIGR02301 family protein [Devosiaceae bacterium]|nr:TIGR02301 family protein [Devosiaceae bacterium]